MPKALPFLSKKMGRAFEALLIFLQKKKKNIACLITYVLGDY